MSSGAWYHIDTLRKAKEIYLVDAENHRLDRVAKYDAEQHAYWTWDGIFPHKKYPSIDEFLINYYVRNPRSLEWYYDGGKAEYYAKQMDIWINIARNAHNNLVFLDRSGIRDFGEFLTELDHTSPPSNLLIG